MSQEEIKIEEVAKKLAGFSKLQDVDEQERYYQSHKCNTYDACLKMAKSDAIKEYWQKGMYTQQQVDELLDRQVCETTALLLKKLYTEEDLKNAFIFGRSSEFDHQMGITGNTKYISFEDWMKQKKNEL